MAKLIWTEKAVAQIEEIGLFIEQGSPFQAHRVIQTIFNEAQRLKDFPRLGKMIPEVQDELYREIRIFSYRLFYRIITEKRIAILGVVHGQKLFDSTWLEIN
jgi:toxin ParE1/3/4